MERYVLRWRMSFSKCSIQRLGIDINDFEVFLSKPKLVIDYAEALIQSRALSYTKIRVSNEVFGGLKYTNEGEAISLNFRIDNIRTPMLLEQYQHLGKREKKNCNYVLIVMIYNVILKMSVLEKEALLDGEFDKKAIKNGNEPLPTADNKTNSHPITEITTRGDEISDMDNMAGETADNKPQLIEENDEDSPFPAAGTEEHARLFAGMGDMFNDSGDVENEGFQHNLSGDEPDIDKM